MVTNKIIESEGKLKVINIGLDGFAKDIRQQDVKVVDVDWCPPADGDPNLNEILKTINFDQDLLKRINNANKMVIERVQNANPQVVDIVSAEEALELPMHTILHAGPPITWDRMCGPQKRAVLGAIQFEGWAEDEDGAIKLVKKEKVTLLPCHQYNAVGPMTGIISPSMPVLVTENETYGNYGFSTFNEGRGNTLWFGVCDTGTLDRLKWIRDTLGPAMKSALKIHGPINVFDIVEQGLQMGDECHARHAASTALLIKQLIPSMLDAGVPGKTVSSIIRFMNENSHFFLNFTLSAVKVTMDSAHNIPFSTIVTGMSRNGVDFMLRVSGLGENYIVGPVSAMDKAVYYTGFTVEDAAGDIGDSAITETCGLGGMAIASAPSLAPFVGGSLSDEIESIQKLNSITLDTHYRFKMPAMDMENTPLGIDTLRVVETRVVPFITTGVLHEASPVVGQIGTGISNVPVTLFDQALMALAKEWDIITQSSYSEIDRSD
jgi:hypothetical protein